MVGAVGDDVAGLRPCVAVLFDGFLRYRVGGVVGGEVEEVGRRVFQFNLDGALVYRLDAEGFNVFFAAARDGFGVFHRVEDEGVFATGRRIDGATPGIDEICRGNRAAV